MPDQSFSKKFRLLTPSDFTSLRARSSSRKQGDWLAYFHHNNNSKKSRLGISISKKVGPAVVRNRYKRIVREVFRCSNFKENGTDVLIVLLPRKAYQKHKLRLDLEHLLETIGR